MPCSRRLLLLAVSLWGVYFLRAHQILALPVFVDESLHILRAQVVFDFTDAVASILPGKLLLYYYLGLFGPDNQSGLWVSRQAVALLVPLCAALSYALVQVFTRSFWMGMIVIWLYATSPLLVYFERMALADTFAMSLALGLIWTCILMARRPMRARRMLVGLLLGLALLAKLTALPLIVVPVLAMRLFGGWSPRALRMVYGVALLTVVLPLAYSVYQEIDPPQNKGEIVQASLYIPQDRSRLGQIVYNAENFAGDLAAFGISIPVVIGLSLLALPLKPYPAMYLLGIVALTWGFLVVASAFPSVRYLTLTFPLLLILVGVVLHHLDAQPIIFYGLTALLLGLGIWGSGFIIDAWNDPSRHTLGEQVEWEYFSHKSSGYAVREAAEDIYRMEDAPLIAGFVGSCHSLRLYGSNARGYLTCPLFRFYDNPALTTPDIWLEAFRARGKAYALVEVEGQEAFAEFDFAAELLGTYVRPHDGEWLKLYRITP